MTHVDTVYEFAGLKFAGALFAVLADYYLPFIIALAGVAYLVHTVADHGEPRRILVYLLYLCLMGWLVSPTEVELQTGAQVLRERHQQGRQEAKVKAPRFLVYLGQATDGVQVAAIEKIDGKFLSGPFWWDRVSAGVSQAQILDAPLRSQVGDFADNCMIAAISRVKGPVPQAVFENPLARAPTLKYETWPVYSTEAGRAFGGRGGTCEEYRKVLEERARAHLKENAFHRELLETAERHDPARFPAFREMYFGRMVANTIDLRGHLGADETALVRRTLGDRSAADLLHADKELNPLAPGLKLLQQLPGLHQWWTDQYTGPQRYYIAVTQGPYIYGFSLMIVLGFFPLVGIWALLPGKWTVLVNYGKVLVSIKLWPVCWALLSSFTAGRPLPETFDLTSVGTVDVWMAVGSMYVATPALCFAVVAIISSATSHAFAAISSAPAGPGAGPIGAVASVAAKARI